MQVLFIFVECINFYQCYLSDSLPNVSPQVKYYKFICKLFDGHFCQYMYCNFWFVRVETVPAYDK